MNCFTFYSLELEAQTLEEADRLTEPIRCRFDNFCDALKLSCYIQRDQAHCIPMFYWFDVHFLYSMAVHKRYSAALVIFADMHGLQFCNEILSVDGKECFSERWHNA